MSWDIFNLLRWLFNEHGGDVLNTGILALVIVMSMRLKDVRMRLNRLEQRIDRIFELLVGRDDKE